MPQGMLIAGWPVTLNGQVLRVASQLRRVISCGAASFGRDRRRLHHRGRQQQQVVRRERGVIGRAQPPPQVLRLGVVVPAVAVERVLAEQIEAIFSVSANSSAWSRHFIAASITLGDIEPLVPMPKPFISSSVTQAASPRIAAHTGKPSPMLRHRHVLDGGAERREALAPRRAPWHRRRARNWDGRSPP